MALCGDISERIMHIEPEQEIATDKLFNIDKGFIKQVHFLRQL
jgi:hypothetical protein